MKSKRMIFNAAVFILLITVTYMLIFRNENIDVLVKNLNNLNINYVILGFISMIFYYIFEAINIKRILSCFKNKISLLKSIKFTLIGSFFSAITPAASGGQPLEIYYMSKENIKVSHSTIALIMHLCGFEMSVVFLGLLCSLFNLEIIKNDLLILFIIGVTLNSLSLTLTLIALFSERLSKVLIKILIKILKFFRVKNINEKEDKINDELKIYHESSKFIKREKKVFIKTIIFAFLQVVCIYTVPYLVYRAFNLDSYTYLRFLSLQSILHCTVSSIPLPGSVGISETVFLRIYTRVFGSLILTDALLISRGISFYIFVIIGLFTVIINKYLLYRKEKNRHN